jgi:phenylacetate-CoA ligase
MLVIDKASSNGAIEMREKDLSAILRHAVTTTRFYKNRNGFKSLKDFPVVNKYIIRESFSSFVSNKFKEPDLIPVVTSGSTGTPFRVLHDRNKKLRNSADVVFFAQRAGYSLGDRLIYLKVWAKQRIKNPVNFWIANIIPVDVSGLNDSIIEDILRQMEDQDSTYNILGYASALELICKYLDKNNYGSVKANVRSVIAMSETLNDYTKRSIRKYFNTTAVSRYSNLENGIIAQQEPAGSGNYLINTASYVLEILKMGSDEPEEQGELGRIVVTDLFNYGMPLIRYDTGDIGAISKDHGNDGNMYLARVEGRKQDMLYGTDGSLISSYLVPYIFEEYTDIVQYQLIQTGEKEYTVKLNTASKFTQEMRLIKELKTCFGEEAVFDVKYVSEIPLLSSGKRKFMINELLKQAK